MTPADGGAAGVTLYREIDALGGAVESEWDKGYSQALTDVLAILERRGFSGTAAHLRYAATNDAPLRQRYITNGKPYEVRLADRHKLKIVDNIGDTIWCKWSGCAHLNGGDWYEVTADGERVQP